jgi:hypothetical protein
MPWEGLGRRPMARLATGRATIGLVATLLAATGLALLVAPAAAEQRDSSRGVAMSDSARGVAMSDSARALAEVDSLAARPWHDRLVAIISDYVMARPSDSLQVDLTPAQDAFREYQGRCIRHIYIEQLDMFSGMPPASEQRPQTFLKSLAHRTHRETRPEVIRQHLLMKEGDFLDPFTLADTERILRSTPFLQDAHIEVIPVPGHADLVDLLVVTRDVWSIGFSLPVDRVDEVRFRIYERNLLGYGHEIEYRRWVETAPPYAAEWEATYAVGNIAGTFIRGEVGLRDRESEQGRRVSFARSPIAPQIHFAAAGSVEAVDRKDLDDEVSGSYRERYDRWDGWLGYNLDLGRNEAGGPGRTSLLPSIRCTWTNYHLPPPNWEEYPARYQDAVLVLGGLEVGRSEYRKARLVFAYGQTEDIPVGYLLGVAAGSEFGEHMDRGYAAVQAGGSSELGSGGGISGHIAVGAYRYEDNWEDGAFDSHVLWFSRLMDLPPVRLRHYARIWYTGGINRLIEEEHLVLDRQSGLRGLRGTSLLGNQRLTLNVETVAFTPWALLGFKLATYGFVDVGTVTAEFGDLLHAHYYESLGGGIRLRNERLVFDTVDLQFAFLPSPPEDAELQTVRFANIGRSPTRTWEVGPPGRIEYR